MVNRTESRMAPPSGRFKKAQLVPQRQLHREMAPSSLTPINDLTVIGSHPEDPPESLLKTDSTLKMKALKVAAK